MDEECRTDELRTLFLFEGLNDEQLATLCANGRITTVQPGPICVEGEPATFFYVLIESELVMSQRSRGDTLETSSFSPSSRWRFTCSTGSRSARCASGRSSINGKSYSHSVSSLPVLPTN